MNKLEKEHIEISTYFHNSFSKLNDPRRTTKGNYSYPLIEILFLVISAVISGMNSWTSISMFGSTKLYWLRKFLPYANGVPSHDVLGKVFARINPEEFNACFMDWINSVSSIANGEVIAIDGKSIKGSGNSTVPHSMLHVVSAFASENKVCLAQTTVNKKENEIIAIPKVLDLLAIKGCVVTIDAMGCQKNIAKKIIEKEADYILMVKDNQKELKDQIKKLFTLQKNFAESEVVTIGHGRIETRKCAAIDDLKFLDVAGDWKNIRSIVRVTSNRYIKSTGKESVDTRYYISSLPANTNSLNDKIRNHWSIENNLHWSLDVIFNEDSALKKKDYSAVNFNIISKIAMAMIQNEATLKASKNIKRNRAALDDDYREKILKS